MSDTDRHDPLAGVSERERAIVAALLRMPPERQKAAAKPATVKGEAQRRRREKERHQPTVAIGGD
jgi:hypothetical protein